MDLCERLLLPRLESGELQPEDILILSQSGAGAAFGKDAVAARAMVNRLTEGGWLVDAQTEDEGAPAMPRTGVITCTTLHKARCCTVPPVGRLSFVLSQQPTRM